MIAPLRPPIDAGSPTPSGVGSTIASRQGCGVGSPSVFLILEKYVKFYGVMRSNDTLD
jgi:hypothetical protein